MRKAHFLLKALILTAFPCVPNALALECGPPPQQFTHNVDAQGQAQAQGLLKKLFDASGEGKVPIIAQDLISKYPNADGTVIVLGLESMYCQIISESNAPDNQKLDMVTKANAELLKWANAPHSSDDTGRKLIGEVRRLAEFPNNERNPGPTTISQSLFANKVPQRLFDILSQYDDDQILSVGDGEKSVKF